LEEPVKPLSYLLVGKIFAALQSCFAQLDGFNKASFFREKPTYSLLRKGIRGTALLGGKFRKLVLLLRGKMHFHTCTV
jgi:hypothetical protein